MSPLKNQIPEISQTLRAKLIPWTQHEAKERFIVARPEMRQADMPYGVNLSPHKIRSKRVIVKSGRCYKGVRNVIARWPEAGLHEVGKYTLVCVLDGHVDYQVGHYKVQCGPGHFIFIPPGLPRPNGERSYVDSEKSTFCTIGTFQLHPHSIECWITHRTVQRSERSRCYLVMHERAVSIFKALMKEVAGDESKSLQISELLLGAFFILLQREFEADNYQSYRSSADLGIETVKASSDDFLAHLESYVQTNLRSPLTLDAVAAEMYFSRAQFVRVMRRETGKSFNEFLSEQRLKEAKKLLLTSQWSITTVASLVGFKSASHFGAFFKRHLGVTPMTFREDGLESAKSPEIKV